MNSEAGPSRKRARNDSEVSIKEETPEKGSFDPSLSERAREKLPASERQPSSGSSLDEAQREFEQSQDLESRSRQRTQAYIEALKAKSKELTVTLGSQ